MLVKNWLRIPVVLMLAALMLSVFVTGCNEESDFDASAIFSLEDYADDEDYARLFFVSAGTWYDQAITAKSYLDVNTENVPFSESVPSGWVPIEETGYLMEEGEELSFWDGLGPNWFIRSHQDSEYEFIRFNEDLPATVTYNPAEVSYGRLFREMTQEGPSVRASGTTLSYSDDYTNRSILAGGANFGDVSLVFASSNAGGDFVNQPAIMISELFSTITSQSADMDNPAVECEIEGTCTLQRVGSLDHIDMDVRATIIVRSNGRGEGHFYVNGAERVRIDIEYIDVTYHGTYTTSANGFMHPERF